MSLQLYGLKTCDTVRKARRWLEQRGIDYQYHDVRDDGLTLELLDNWADQLGWEALVNRRSTTWKQLPASTREPLDRHRALALLMEHPTLLKRPLLVSRTELLQGFSPENYEMWYTRHTL